MSNLVPRIGSAGAKNAVFAELSNNDNAKLSFRDLLANGINYEVARLSIPARCNLPLQSGHQTSRHLTVLSGIIHVTLGEDVLVLVADESVYIPQRSLHGLENRADETSLVICVDYTA